MSLKVLEFPCSQPEKTAHILKYHHCFPWKTSEEGAQKFYSDDMSLLRSGKCMVNARTLLQLIWLKQSSHIAPPIRSTTQIWVVKHLYFGISVHRGNQWRLQRSAVFSGFINFLHFLWSGEGGGGIRGALEFSLVQQLPPREVATCTPEHASEKCVEH